MSERKVLNKYFAPNYDPNVQVRRMGGGRQKKVRLMAPFSMQCNTCGDYIYKGKKFNARKERAIGEDYLGIQIFRFYIRCPLCANEITFKTDPQHTDYQAEHGAQRNFEPWRDETQGHQEVKADRIKLEEDNPMKALENRTLDSKREMDILDALDEIRTKNAQFERADLDKVLEKIHGVKSIEIEDEVEQLQDEQDEILIKSLFQVDGEKIKRVTSDEKSFKKPVKPETKPAPVSKSSSSIASTLGIKRKSTETTVQTVKRKTVPVAAKPAKPLIAVDYGESDSD
ncbi:hypothetical protein HDV02_005020 [Globomyces sp. JEL0801]|nr:hypothetical protein HDV02_005020 [Globomyces sp. JEL0801]